MALINMLPYRGSTETVDTQNAFNQEIELVSAARDDLFLQFNVETATWGLYLWETAYGISHDATICRVDGERLIVPACHLNSDFSDFARFKQIHL